MNSENLQTTSSLFAFLKDLLKLRNRPIKKIDTYANASGHWVHHLDETPATKNGIAFWGSLGLRALNALQGDVTSVVQLGITTFKETKNSILRIPKIVTPEPPQLSEVLGPWVEGDLEDAFNSPELLDAIDLSSPEDEQVVTTAYIKDHPNIVREFDAWLGKWTVWAEKVKEDLVVQRLYEAVFNAREQVRDQSQDWEFILGLGRLRLGTGTDKEIDRHIFTVNCTIDLDPTTGVLFVRVDEDASFRIEDDWIQNFKKPEMTDLNLVLESLGSAVDLTDESIKTELVKLAHKFRADIITDLEPMNFKKKDSLVLAPSLILRKKGKRNLIELLQTLEDKFAESNSIPAPLLSLIEPGYGEKTSSSDWSGDGAVIALDKNAYLPLALNAKQIKALESADSRNATIVQGPPGTGKTRTIAVMIAHFLAKGQRVLVAAQTPQALREVRSKLPDEIKNLAVANLGSSKSDNDDLQKAVNSLVEAYENRSELYDNFTKYEEDLNEKIAAKHEERAEAIRKIVDLRSSETEILDIEGSTGSRAHLAWVHLDQRHDYAWLEEISNPKAKAPQFTSSDADRLSQGLKQIWSSSLNVASALPLPRVEELWNVDKLKKIEGLKRALNSNDESLTLVPEFASELVKIMDPVISQLNYLNSSKHNWVQNVISQNISIAEKPFMQRVEEATKSLLSLEKLSSELGNLADINSGPSNLGWLPVLDAVTALIAKKGELKTSTTGEVKSNFISSSVLKNAQPVLNQVKILGKAPSTVEEITRVKALVNFDHLIKTFTDLMMFDPSQIPSSRYEQLLWVQDNQKLLNASKEFEIGCKTIRDYLNRKLAKTSHYLSEDLDLPNLYDAAVAKNASVELQQIQSDLTAHKALIRIPISGQNIEYINRYLELLDSNNFEVFEGSRAILIEYITAQKVKLDLIDAMKNLVPGDNLFVESVVSWVDMEGTNQSEESLILEKVDGLVSAFGWKRLGQSLGGTDTSDYAKLFETVTRSDAQIEGFVRELARRRSWKKALDRIDAKTISQMQRYALESRKLGAGTGITAHRRIKEIRKLLNDCVPAIPAWIMPIDAVAEKFPAELELFDVVIVDEASQARLDSIFLLALSKRVVIVGDHKQVSPEGGMIADAEVQQIVNRHLANDPRKANWGNADLSLFDECKAAFGNMITLTEHRRCVPEIIGFSNQIAYIPENIRLIPVRQTGSQAIQPVKTVFVPNGYVRLSGSQPENQPEAEAVVSEIISMIKNPAYRNMTIGVVTLQGTAQRELISRLILKSIDPLEIENRQIKVGTPPDFQGSERNVILLSMVMAPNGSRAAQTKETMVQRYNVATSRAKDQLVLVHSLRASDIKNQNDLRRLLIEYCTNMENGQKNAIHGTVGIVPNDEKVEPFDSLFEQRVHNRLVERGFSVIPQYEPQIDGHAYRIDLVVVGPHGKFAIECDGDFWHGPEQFENDLIRQETLERCGWQFYRITESKFYSDPTALDELWPRLQNFVATSIETKEAIPSTSLAENSEIITDLEVDLSEEDHEDLEHNLISEDLEVEKVHLGIHQPGTPIEKYQEGLRIREFPKPMSPEFNWLQAYQSWEPEESRRFTKVESGGDKILDELLEIAQVEGPILGGYLMRKHYKATGGSSLSSAKSELYIRHLKRLINRAEIRIEEQPNGKSLAEATMRTEKQEFVITRVRGVRELYDMPPRELAMIIRGVMKTKPELARSNNRELLFRQVLLLLDFTKLTKKAEDHLNRVWIAYEADIVAK